MLSMHKQPSPIRAVAWMMGTLLSFSLMAICARELSGAIPTQQTLFFRSVIGLACLSIFLLATKQGMNIQTHRFGVHALRNVFHFAGQYGWFIGIGLLPLAEVFALEFTVPIWTLIVAAIVLRETITKGKVLSIVLGSVGVVVILQPGISIINGASFVVLGSAICYAVSHTVTKSLSASESVVSILFYMCLIQLPIGLSLSLFNWIWPVGLQWMWLLIIGLTALSAHYCMVNAMRYAEVSTIVTLDFLRLPLIAWVGVMLYSEPLEMALIVGGLLMLVANTVSLKKTDKNR